MDSSDAWPLAWGLISVLAIFAIASSSRRTVSIAVLLIMVPFQAVETRYGSSSVLLAYVLGAVLLLMRGRMKVRLMPWLGLIALAYLSSLALAERQTLLFNAIFCFQFFSCFVVFLLAYNFALEVESERSIANVLIAINWLIVGYCLLQLTVGPGERFVPFGIEALQFNQNRSPDDPRLVGAFGNPGTTAGYFTLMSIFCAVEFMFSTGRRRLAVGLLTACNLVGLVATGNRAGFLVLLAMFLGLLFFYRRDLGARRMVQYLVGGTAVLTIAAAVAVTSTGFDRMFKRLSTVTETEGGLPATRQGGWPVAIEKFKREPWFGEGPYFWSEEDAERIGELRVEYDMQGELDTAYDPFPHSLVLYLLRTVGIFGLVAVVGFFIRAWFVINAAVRRIEIDTYMSAIARTGIIIIPAFLVTQVTLEFNRPSTMDYAQFIFTLLGLLIGASDRVRDSFASPVQEATHIPRTAIGLDRRSSIGNTV